MYTDSDGEIYWFDETRISLEKFGLLSFDDKMYYLHRENGPALIWRDNQQEWWLDGEEYSFDNWLEVLDAPVERKVELKLEWG